MTILRFILRLLSGWLIRECRRTNCEDCRYLARVKAKYTLNMTQAQIAEMNAERWQD